MDPEPNMGFNLSLLEKYYFNKQNKKVKTVVLLFALVLLLLLLITFIAPFRNKIFKMPYPKIQSKTKVDVGDRIFTPTSVPVITPTPLPIGGNGRISSPQTAFKLSGSTSVAAGNQFSVQVLTRSDSEAANLFSADLVFQPQFLEVISVDTTGSFITNWIEQFIDNTEGELSLIGGLPTPGLKTSGSDILIAKAYFRAKSVGVASITFNNANTHIYSNVSNKDILASTTGITINIVQTK